MVLGRLHNIMDTFNRRAIIAITIGLMALSSFAQNPPPIQRNSYTTNQIGVLHGYETNGTFNDITIGNHPKNPGNTNYMFFRFGPTNSANWPSSASGLLWGSGDQYPGGAWIVMLPDHSGADPSGNSGELIMSSSGKLCFGAGQMDGSASRGIQFGIGKAVYPYLQGYNELTNAWDGGTNTYCSSALSFVASSGGIYSGRGTSSGGPQGPIPSVMLYPTGTNGQASLRFYDWIDTGSGGSFNLNQSQVRAELGIGPYRSNGFWRIYGQSLSDTHASAFTALNLGLPAVAMDITGTNRDYTVSAAAITVYATNSFNTGYGGDVSFILRRRIAGTTTITYDPLWTTNGVACPTSLTAGKLIFLEMFISGIGPTNVILKSAQLYTDNAYSPPPQQQEAINYNIASAMTNVVVSNALNQLVIEMKAAGVWDTNGACYPFCAETANGNRWNLFNTNTYRGTNNGNLTSDAVHTLAGPQSDGTGYFQTGFVFSDTNKMTAAVFSTTQITNGFKRWLWVRQGSTNLIDMGTDGGVGTNMYFTANTATPKPAANNAKQPGFYCITRTNNTITGAHWYAPITDTNSYGVIDERSSNAPQDYSVNLWGMNGVGFANTASAAGQLQFALLLNNGLTTVQVRALEAAILNFKGAIGR